MVTFFKSLLASFCKKTPDIVRLDLLACSALRPPDIGYLGPALEKLIEVCTNHSKIINCMHQVNVNLHCSIVGTLTYYYMNIDWQFGWAFLSHAFLSVFSYNHAVVSGDSIY